MIKGKFIMSTVLIAVLSIPTLAYAETNNSVEKNKDTKLSLEQKDDIKRNKLYEKHEKCEGNFKKTADDFSEYLEKAEGLTQENKTALETAMQKQKALREEIYKLTGVKIDNKEQLDVETKEQIKVIKDKVKNGEITKEEAQKQMRELRRANSEQWKNLSEAAKAEIKGIEAEIDKNREARKQIANDFKKAVTDKNVDAINTNAKKLTDSLNVHNELLQKKIDVLNKYIKK